MSLPCWAYIYSSTEWDDICVAGLLWCLNEKLWGSYLVMLAVVRPKTPLTPLLPRPHKDKNTITLTSTFLFFLVLVYWLPDFRVIVQAQTKFHTVFPQVITDAATSLKVGVVPSDLIFSHVRRRWSWFLCFNILPVKYSSRDQKQKVFTQCALWGLPVGLPHHRPLKFHRYWSRPHSSVSAVCV